MCFDFLCLLLQNWCVTAVGRVCRTPRTVTPPQASVCACQATLDCSARCARTPTSPTAPAAVCPAAVTPSVPSTNSVTGERPCWKLHCGKCSCCCWRTNMTIKINIAEFLWHCITLLYVTLPCDSDCKEWLSLLSILTKLHPFGLK